MGIHSIHETLTLPVTLEVAWDFISNPGNLRKITPAHMGFEITTPGLPQTIYPGMIISYKVAPLLRIKMTWVTEITHVRELQYFVDEQRIGPYAMWHHEHQLESAPEGVRMTDIVSYKLPFGIIGNWAHRLFVKRQLNAIFQYRREKLELMFGKG
jgi:ligand-binding SRPBCC domain-containing protein